MGHQDITEDRLKKEFISFTHSSALSFCFSFHRSGVAMPFGCLTIGEKKDYNNPSDVTDKYDLGQIVKSWVFQVSCKVKHHLHKHLNDAFSSSNPWSQDLFMSCKMVLFREEFCEIFRAKDKTTMKMYTCKKFLKKDGRKVRKAAKNEILILKM